MAQKVQVILVDDIDGGEATETVSFGLDGTSYEIDLSADNAATLRDSLAQWVGSARKAGRSSSRPASRGRSSAAADREQTQAIRAWARKQGHKVNDRGRIPADIVAAYNASS
ncbi:MAG TPA: Lsr2 family protein [Mycobacteriales bacterium]|nr:Lsr2 family protein [Mycobacteriales bacterium]